MEEKEDTHPNCTILIVYFPPHNSNISVQLCNQRDSVQCAFSVWVSSVCAPGVAADVAVARRSLLWDGPCVTAEITPISGCRLLCCRSRALFVLVPQAWEPRLLWPISLGQHPPLITKNHQKTKKEMVMLLCLFCVKLTNSRSCGCGPDTVCKLAEHMYCCRLL